MDNLSKALEEIKLAEDISYGHDLTLDMALTSAQAYAAIAQAEQLKRIADALEIMAHPNRIVAPDPQDYFSEDAYNTAAENYDYNKNSRAGESMSEYKARRAAGYA